MSIISPAGVGISILLDFKFNYLSFDDDYKNLKGAAIVGLFKEHNVSRDGENTSLHLVDLLNVPDLSKFNLNQFNDVFVSKQSYIIGYYPEENSSIRDYLFLQIDKQKNINYAEKLNTL